MRVAERCLHSENWSCVCAGQSSCELCTAGVLMPMPVWVLDVLVASGAAKGESLA